jgi:site-specific DNA recombinase
VSLGLSAGRAVGYVRVSTQEQAESGLGLLGQETAIKAAAERLHLTVDAIYTDAGFSGSLGLEYRRGLADAIAALRKGGTLLVSRRDRVARDSFNSIVIEREVAKRGGRIVSAQGEGTGDDDPGSVFVRRVLDAVAELERALIAARTRAAMAEAKKRGQRTGHVPYGMRLANDGRMLERDEGEQATLALVRKLRALGYAQRDIADELNRLGIKTRRGDAFQRSFVAQLLARHSAEVA